MLLGAGAKKDDPLYLDDVFNTSLWTGSSGKRSISSGIKLNHGNYSVDFDGDDELEYTGVGNIGTTTDFTMECWVYLDGTSGVNRIFSADQATESDQNTLIRVHDGAWAIYIGQAHPNSWNYSGGSVSTSTWYHVALVRSGSNMYFFVDGSVQAFTPSTEALTLSSQGASPAKVALLCCNDAYILGGSKATGTQAESGNPTVSTSSPFATDSSLYGGLVWVKARDQGTGDYHNMLFDTERGWGKALYSNLNAAQPGANSGTFLLLF